MINFGRITQRECLDVPTPTDPRCGDPAFALANPDICPASPQLFIKPGTALTCPLGSVPFRAYILRNGQEVEVTSDSVFAVSNPAVAVIGAGSGNATGIAEGDVTVSVLYGGMTALAHLSVLGETKCDGDGDCQATVAFMVMLDDSRSMSQAFSATYPTRFAFAKAAAAQFISEVNTQKDVIGLMRFNGVDNAVLSGLTDDKASVATLVSPILQTQEKTAFLDATTTAIAELLAEGADVPVLVLISDGEETVSDTDKNSTITLLNDFKLNGGIVVCLGVRASSNLSGFNLLSAFSTGGFFVNAYQSNETVALANFSGLKGFFCAGNCVPTGDELVNTGQLDYDGFANWDVDGHVDLIGNGFFDFLPGNGLYVDLSGSTAPFKGTLTLKSALPLTAGDTYEFTFVLAGNQRLDVTPEKVQFKVKTSGTTLFSHTISFTDFLMGFTQFSYAYTPGANMDVIITVEQLETPASQEAIGLLLASVKVENLSDHSVIFEDDFDDENPVYVPPACGTGTTYVELTPGNFGYAIGYNCYGTGCLDEPPVGQGPDPSPLSDIEGGYTPPQTFSSTKEVCKECVEGTVNTTPVEVGTHTAGSVIVLAAESVVGSYSVVASLVAGDGYATAWTFSGSHDNVNWTVVESRSGQTFTPSQSRTYNLVIPAVFKYFKLEVTATTTPTAGSGYSIATYKIYGYTVNETQQVCLSATGTGSSQAAADAAAIAAATALVDAQLHCQAQFTSTKSAMAACPLGWPIFTRSASATSFISQDDADDQALAAAQVLANADRDASGCDESNNLLPLTINDATASAMTAATPYPGVKNISASAIIGKVVVNIYGFTHGFTKDVRLLLMSPAGTMVELLRNVGDVGAVAVDLEFADDAAAAMVESDPIVSGSFKPSLYGAQASYPSPCPASPYGSALSDFVGENQQGNWALYVVDDSPDDTGSIASWDLTITP